MRRRVRVRPSRPTSILSLLVGIVFCLLGIFVIIPSAGLFGVFWTLVAAGITAVNALPLFGSKEGYTREIVIDESDDPDADNLPAPQPASDAEQRLRALQDLYTKGLITRDEYDEKRAKILDEL